MFRNISKVFSVHAVVVSIFVNNYIFTVMLIEKSQIFYFYLLGGGSSVGGASGQLVVTATHPFTGQQPGDLSFVPGDRITVITKTESQYDWWEGQLEDGRVGIFPANFVTY